MRIISQDGSCDLPYEQTELFASVKTIYADSVSVEDTVMAIYSSEEKAIKAMKMCREKYQGFFTKGNCMFDHPKVFQFPADDEI